SVLDRMARQAWNEDLAQAFTQHRVETEGHVDRLHRVFKAVGAKPTRGSSAAVEALVAEGQRLMARHMDRDVRDAWLIATAQRVEHLEIANYGTVRTYAQLLGFTSAAQLLQQTLDEERAADQRLTQLAERFVNPQSLHMSHAKSSKPLGGSGEDRWHRRVRLLWGWLVRQSPCSRVRRRGERCTMRAARPN